MFRRRAIFDRYARFKTIAALAKITKSLPAQIHSHVSEDGQLLRAPFITSIMQLPGIRGYVDRRSNLAPPLHNSCSRNNKKEGSMSQTNDKLEKIADRQEEIIATLINPIHVFSGAVSTRDYILAQKQLLRDFGEDIYFNWQLEILHAEIASIIEEIKMESSGLRPNTSVCGQA
jgi:hypothetical protein